MQDDYVEDGEEEKNYATKELDRDSIAAKIGGGDLIEEEEEEEIEGKDDDEEEESDREDGSGPVVGETEEEEEDMEVDAEMKEMPSKMSNTTQNLSKSSNRSRMQNSSISVSKSQNRTLSRSLKSNNRTLNKSAKVHTKGADVSAEFLAGNASYLADEDERSMTRTSTSKSKLQQSRLEEKSLRRVSSLDPAGQSTRSQSSESDGERTFRRELDSLSTSQNSRNQSRESDSESSLRHEPKQAERSTRRSPGMAPAQAKRKSVPETPGLTLTPALANVTNR